MSDSLFGGRHHRVIGCDDDDGDIGSLGTTGTHGGKRLVTWSIKEGNLAATVQRNTVCTDMLGNTTCLTKQSHWYCGYSRAKRSYHGLRDP